MEATERKLGPRWSVKELRTFYILLKAHGQQWDKLQERLPLRSEAMVRALFDKHRGYLSLPEASVEGFCAIMTDHYQSQTRTEEGAVIPVQDTTQQIRTEAAHVRKKRRLEKLLDCEQLETLKIGAEEQHHQQRQMQSHRQRARKSVGPRKWRAWLPKEGEMDPTRLANVRGRRFNLPMGHWFYSYVDVDFFRHNEFVECLRNMGLGKITAAARPIWSSVRATMGRPRRLSPLFFAQEKAKLETYRGVKRQLDPNYQPDSAWPYKCPAPLHPGATVIVWMEIQQRCQLGTVAKVNFAEGFCHVVFDGLFGDDACAPCSFDNTMILDFPPWSREDKAPIPETKLAATTLLRHQNGLQGYAPPRPVHLEDARYREEQLRAVLMVKSLLHRKEKIIAALSGLNKQVADQQKQLQRQNAMTSSLWTTPTAFSSAAVKDLAWASPREKTLVQRQHSWLIANLDATNSCLMSALVNLESFSSSNQNWSVAADGTSSVYSTEEDALNGGDGASVGTLTVEQMRWAIDFLSASQQKADTVVAASVLEVAEDETTHGSSEMASRQKDVLPDTMHLVANCVALMSVLHRRGAAAPDVHPAVTQTLVERLLELLKPAHDANMDLYTELRTAAEGAQLQMAMKPPKTSRK